MCDGSAGSTFCMDSVNTIVIHYWNNLNTTSDPFKLKITDICEGKLISHIQIDTHIIVCIFG